MGGLYLGTPLSDKARKITYSTYYHEEQECTVQKYLWPSSNSLSVIAQSLHFYTFSRLSFNKTLVNTHRTRVCILPRTNCNIRYDLNGGFKIVKVTYKNLKISRNRNGRNVSKKVCPFFP